MRKSVAQTIAGYIRGQPASVRRKLVEMRAAIGNAAPGAVEAISYQIPTFRLNGKNLVHFAAFKNHIGFFPTSSEIRAFKKELAGFKTSRGAVQFPLERPIPYGLVKRITRFRVKEVSQSQTPRGQVSPRQRRR